MSRFFERNTSLKVISIIIALILWGMTPNNRDPVRNMSFRDIPIKIENQQKLSENGLMISSKMPDTYSFDIRAKGSSVRYVDESKIVAVVNLSEINKTGEQNVDVEIQGLPSNIERKSVPAIKINIEKVISKTVPVLPKVADKDNLELGKRYYEINPRFVEIRGPESMIDTVAYAQVSMSLGAEDKKIERSLAVQLLDENDNPIELGFLTIEPEYCVTTVYPNRDIKVEPVITGEPADGFIVTGKEVKPEEVTISADPDILESIDTITTDVLDIEGAKSDIIKEVKLQEQEDIRLSPGQSSSVQVIIRIERIVDKSVDLGDVEMRNVPEGLEANLDEMEEDMTVTLSGAQSLVNAFKTEDLKAYMDLKESSRGERTLPILVDKLPDGLEVTNIEPKNLKVNIK